MLTSRLRMSESAMIAWSEIIWTSTFHHFLCYFLLKVSQTNRKQCYVDHLIESSSVVCYLLSKRNLDSA